MNPQLTDEQTATLKSELRNIAENDRYPFSPRIRTLREVLHMIRPEPLTSGQRCGGTASTPARERTSTSPPTLRAAASDIKETALASPLNETTIFGSSGLTLAQPERARIASRAIYCAVRKVWTTDLCFAELTGGIAAS
jgi:hypothetical protein